LYNCLEIIEFMEVEITLGLTRKILKKRNEASNKSDFGHALIVAGSKGKVGAAIIASKACLRTGSGMLTTHTSGCAVNSLHTRIPEAMVESDNNYDSISAVKIEEKYSVIGIGPGIGTSNVTQKAFKKIIRQFENPMVIDADGINILSKNLEWMNLLPRNSILTPHDKEFERLVGKWKTDADRQMLQKELSKKYSIIIVLKGHRTTISNPDGDLFINSTGNPGMAKAGSGDALTGIITSFVAQSYSPMDASVLGVYLHGLAGDIAAKEKTEFSLLASDLIEFIPNAFKKLI